MPVIMISLIFQKIELESVLKYLPGINLALLIIGILFWPLTIFLGAWRWQNLSLTVINNDIKYPYFLKHYWASMPIGLLTPATVGWDAYRVIILGRRFGSYLLHTLNIALEKFLALLINALFVILLYPFVDFSSGPLTQVIQWAYIAVGCLFLIIFSLTVIGNKVLIRNAMQVLFNQINKMTFYLLCKIGRKETEDLRQTIRPLFNWKNTLIPILASAMIVILISIGSHILFQSVHHEVPFLTNLFATPIILFALTIPISVAGIGVREAVFILVYGLFSVPAESALLVSFFSFAGMMVSYAIGTLISLFIPKHLNNRIDH